MNPRRHKSDTKTFEELSFQEQAKAMNMTALQFRKQLAAHLRRADEEGRSRGEVLAGRLGLLQRILEKYDGKVRKQPKPIRATLSLPRPHCSPSTDPASS